ILPADRLPATEDRQLFNEAVKTCSILPADRLPATRLMSTLTGRCLIPCSILPADRLPATDGTIVDFILQSKLAVSYQRIVSLQPVTRAHVLYLIFDIFPRGGPFLVIVARRIWAVLSVRRLLWMSFSETRLLPKKMAEFRTVFGMLI